MPTFKENPKPAVYTKSSGFKMTHSNSAFPFKSPAKDMEQNEGFIHPHVKPSSKGGVTTDKHGNRTYYK